jgi:hypothetical protein
VPELEPDLHAVCDLCAQNVSPGDGYLWVDNDEVARCEKKTAAWEAEHPTTENMTGDNLRTRPGPARWRVTHTACEPGSRGDAYAIELDRIMTFRDLAGWTIHLLGKRWLRYTDWDELAEDALGAGGGRLVSRYTEPWHG